MSFDSSLPCCHAIMFLPLRNMAYLIILTMSM